MYCANGASGAYSKKKNLELLVMFQFILPLALVDNAGIYDPNLSFNMYSTVSVRGL